MKMRRIGLTGGIASGKSTVSEILKREGYPVIDADETYHRLVDFDSALTEALGETFDQAVIRRDGSLDRAVLSDLIFSDPKKRKELNALTHPAILEAMEKQAAQIEQQEGNAPSPKERSLLFFDIPLLFESGDLSKRLHLDGIWLVSVSLPVQEERLMIREGIDAEEAKRRIAAQMPLAEKEKYATRILRNDGNREDLEDLVQEALLKETE